MHTLEANGEPRESELCKIGGSRPSLLNTKVGGCNVSTLTPVYLHRSTKAPFGF